MLFKKNTPFQIIRAPKNLKGSGFFGINFFKPGAKPMFGRFARNKFYFWGLPISSYHIRLRKAQRLLDKFEEFGALIFGLGFLILFFWVLSVSGLIEAVFYPKFWLTSGNLVNSLFWLGVIAFSFFYYKKVTMKREPKEVENREFLGTMAKPKEVTPPSMEWSDAAKIARKKRIDIAESFTEDVNKVLENSYKIAEENGDSEMRPVHIFYELLDQPKISSIFIRLRLPVKKIRNLLFKQITNKKNKKTPRITEDIQQILMHAYDEAYLARQEYVNLTELLVATVGQSEFIQELLYDLEVDKQKLTNVVEWLRINDRLRQQYQTFSKAAARRSKYGMDRAMTAVATPFLNSFSQDLTMAAKYGHLTPCVARDKEIEEIFRIVEGGRQSVLLVGERGVGKMSIIEGIAQRMIEDNTPDRLKDKRLVQLSTSALLAGTTVSGAQQRMINIMNEIARAGNIILFIRNVHDLVSISGAGGEEGLDVSETLAEFLRKGAFLTFATSSVDGYNRHILRSEMSSVFAKVDVDIMDENQAIQVLESKVGQMEYKHKVFFSYDAIEQAVRLATRYLQDQNLPESAIELMTESASHARSQRGNDSLVLGNDVGSIVSNKTGIPTTTISEKESDKLLRLEQEMHKRIVGQELAVQLVANALRRARAEIRSQKKPIANFLFLGPTGVGKTELAKTIADTYFGGEDRMIRIDMSEYQDKSGIYRLIGQPGQQGTGILTEAVRQNPFSLVLLDEMEKADKDVLNLFLQVFDDGRLTDSVGRVIDFTNTIIIATSNAGTSFVQDQINKGVPLDEIRQKMIRTELKKYYRPEFLNRFDGIVLFKALERDEIKKIAGLMLKRVEKDLEQKGVGLRVEDAALEGLAQVGFDPEFGARPMRRAIQEHVENKLAEMFLAGKLKRRDVVVLGEGIEVRVERG